LAAHGGVVSGPAGGLGDDARPALEVLRLRACQLVQFMKRRLARQEGAWRRYSIVDLHFTFLLVGLPLGVLAFLGTPLAARLLRLGDARRACLGLGYGLGKILFLRVRLLDGRLASELAALAALLGLGDVFLTRHLCRSLNTSLKEAGGRSLRPLARQV